MVSQCVFAPFRAGGTDIARITRSVMHGHISAFSTIIFVGEELAHKVFQCKTTLLKDSCLAILCEYCIVWSQCRCGSNTDAFFTRGYLEMSMARPIIFDRVTHHIEAQTTLSLCLEHDPVHDAHWIFISPVPIIYPSLASGFTHQSTYSYTTSRSPDPRHQQVVSYPFQPAHRLNP